MKVKQWKKVFHASINQNNIAGVAKKNRFQVKKFTRDKEAHILIRISVQKEDITVMNTYAHSNRACKYLNQSWTELNEEIILQ